MTNDQIRRKIAEACGYNGIHAGTPIGLWGTKFPTRAITEIPNYPESHDAMAEALGTLSEKELIGYFESLNEVIAQPFKASHFASLEKIVKMSPLQKSAAFLKAKGLWEESK